jgi:hypothetical protein
MPSLSDLLRWPLRALKGLFGGLLALIILFEEWGWEPLQRALARIGQLPGLRWIERQISSLPPYAALAIFLIPSALLLPIKLLALWLISRSWIVAGTLVIVAAKLVGTAVVARLFTLTQPALMTLPWFARLYTRWSAWKTALLERVRASRPWRLARQMRQQLRSRWLDWKAKWDR